MLLKSKIFKVSTLTIVLLILVLTYLYLPKFLIGDSFVLRNYNIVEDSANYVDPVVPVTEDSKVYNLSRERGFEFITLRSDQLNPNISYYAVLHSQTSVDNKIYANIDLITLERDSIFDFDWKIDYPIKRVTKNNSIEESVTWVNNINLNSFELSNNETSRNLLSPLELNENSTDTEKVDFPSCDEIEPEFREQLEAQADPSYDGIKYRYSNPNCPELSTP
jgi:hypothetical protein